VSIIWKWVCKKKVSSGYTVATFMVTLENSKEERDLPISERFSSV
jgi:hypothetical protein